VDEAPLLRGASGDNHDRGGEGTRPADADDDCRRKLMAVEDKIPTRCNQRKMKMKMQNEVEVEVEVEVEQLKKSR